MTVSESIDFVAAVAQIRTLADGGIRVVLDLPEDAIEQAAWLMQAKRNDEAVRGRMERLLGDQFRPGAGMD